MIIGKAERCDMEQDLSDKQCDRLVAMAMDALAKKYGMCADDLNPDIMEHHSLRRSIVRVAYELGKSTSDKASNAQIDIKASTLK